jgi:hypothetical protein
MCILCGFPDTRRGAAIKISFGGLSVGNINIPPVVTGRRDS